MFIKAGLSSDHCSLVGACPPKSPRTIRSAPEYPRLVISRVRTGAGMRCGNAAFTRSSRNALKGSSLEGRFGLVLYRGSARDRRYFLTVFRDNPVIRVISRMLLCCFSLRILTSIHSSFPVIAGPPGRLGYRKSGSKFSCRGGSFLHCR